MGGGNGIDEMQDLRQLTEASIKTNPSIATSPTTTAPREKLISGVGTRRQTISVSQETQQVPRVHTEASQRMQQRTAPIVPRLEQQSALIINQATRVRRKHKQHRTAVNITVNAAAPAQNT